MENSYPLIGNFTYAGDLPGPLTISSESELPLEILDGNGKPVNFNLRADIQPDVRWGGVSYWAVEISKPVSGPLKIIVDSVNIHKSDITQFQFDTGPDPQIGQEWQLNLPIKLGGHDYVIDRIKMVDAGYRFYWHSGFDVPEGTSYSLSIQGIKPLMSKDTSGMEDRRGDEVKYAQDFFVEGTFPNGILTVDFNMYQIAPLSGPWILYWTPPNK